MEKRLPNSPPPPPPLHRSVKLWGVHTLLRDKKIRRKRALLSHSRAPVQCSTKLIFFIYVHRTPPDSVLHLSVYTNSENYHEKLKEKSLNAFKQLFQTVNFDGNLKKGQS